MPSSWPPERLLGWLLPLLAVVTEGAWLTVVYVTVETGIDGQRPLLSVLELSIPVGLAALAVRRGWLNPDEQPLRFFGALLVTGAIGWMWDASVRDALARGDAYGAIGLHPGGWLMLVAFMRGVGRGVTIDDRTQTRVVLLGVPALALPWFFGHLTAGSLRPIFVEEAFAASITFAAAGFMAAGLARLSEIGRETGIDWRRDRSWLGLIAAALVVVLAAGVPAALVLGVPLDVVARGVLGPVLPFVAYVIVAVAYVLAYIVSVIPAALSALGFELPPPDPNVGIGPPGLDLTFDQVRGPLLGIGLLWAALALLTIVVAVAWVRRRRVRPPLRADEERSFHLPPARLRLRMPRFRSADRRRPSGVPRDAVTAYLGALRLLAEHPPLGRAESETPRTHASRVSGTTDPELGALQADYTLARYGGRLLTDAEHRRALGRWRRLRERLRTLRGDS